MKKVLLAFGIVSAVAVILIAAAYSSGDFAEWYAVSVYPLIVGVVARITGLLPFSLYEILIVLLILLVLFGIVMLIICAVKKRFSLKKYLKYAGTTVFSVAMSALLIFTLNCGINYHRHEFSTVSGLTVREYTKEELFALAESLIDEAKTAAQSVETDENGHFTYSEKMMSEARSAMESLSESYPTLRTYYPNAKPMLFSEIMCRMWLTGVYSPFTVEANFNNMAPAAEKAATVCHELSHLTGYMREDEANFIAYLACRESDCAELSYSGAIFALTQTLNACYKKADSGEYVRLLNKIDELTYNEICLQSEFWQSYKSVVSEAASAVNDVYLKVNNQTDGTESYGRMVDLLLADFLARRE